jgi:hypothetical protein
MFSIRAGPGGGLREKYLTLVAEGLEIFFGSFSSALDVRCFESLRRKRPMLNIQHPTSNIQHSTFNIQR